MTLLGKAAVAMWWDMAPAQRAEFEDWHSHEHFPERMSIPGFLRGSRWASSEGADGFFVLYELETYETLTSSHYLARLNDPTPWSTKMMPHHRNMVRSQCRVTESFGGGIAMSMMTLRLSPKPGEADALRHHLQHLLSRLPAQPGLTGAHLLYTQTPETGLTQEQKIRGGADAVADWIVLVSGYDAAALATLAASGLNENSLTRAGALPSLRFAHFSQAYALAQTDV
ncbi:MAG: hypothetical protein JWR89_591 [Tardiphaga sp.]|jgi:hypothetical protein|uniref:DUF4286 family protein n=1 Tax=Tardiphaga sp. TaxID=1926292 RepID=UPI00262EC934|nr:DUF4286 family protein [Tardiphaga sp.]MDB5500689.1 hypothetical protein [Tardiphaga sp.]